MSISCWRSSTCISARCRRSPSAPVRQLHLGGGTPTFLSGAALGNLVDGLLRAFALQRRCLRRLGRGGSARDRRHASRSAGCARLPAALARRAGSRSRRAASGQPRATAVVDGGAVSSGAVAWVHVHQSRPHLWPARSNRRHDGPARGGRARAFARSPRGLQLCARSVDQAGAAAIPRRSSAGRRGEARAVRSREGAASRRRLHRDRAGPFRAAA